MSDEMSQWKLTQIKSTGLLLLGRAFTDAWHELRARKIAAAPKENEHRRWFYNDIV
jgi:hypothetical protein